VDELRNLLKPEIVNLVQRQRLGFIVNGTRFKKMKKGGSTTNCLFLRVNHNHKILYYGDCGDNDSDLPIESLSNKIAISDIRGLKTDKVTKIK